MYTIILSSTVCWMISCNFVGLCGIFPDISKDCHDMSQNKIRGEITVMKLHKIFHDSNSKTYKKQVI